MARAVMALDAPNSGVEYATRGGVDAPSAGLATTDIRSQIMVDYTIAAIPTLYNGVQYRSRLEARWAAFFDLMGWEFQYEPFELGIWSPDFLLRGRYSSEVLVEVKPITDFDRATAARMSGACFERGMGGDGAILLLGVCPFRVGGYVQMGWVGDTNPDTPDAQWNPGIVTWVMTPDKPGVQCDVIRCECPLPGNPQFLGILGDTYIEGEGLPGAKFYPDHCMSKWTAATNTVQWKPRA